MNPTLTSSSKKTFEDTFGNYMLHGFEEIYLPDAIAWWPHTIGWQILLAGMLLWISRIVYKNAKGWRRNRYRRLALKHLNAVQAASAVQQRALTQLPELLKATALQAYPRDEVAQLSGSAWLELLDDKCSGSAFDSDLGQHLLTLAYQPEHCWQIDKANAHKLIEMCRRWIKCHKADARVVPNV